MPKGHYQRKPRTVLVETLVPVTTFTELSWWGKLNGDEQKDILDEGQKLAHALFDYGKSKMAIGEHLSKIQAILEPHNLCGKFLKNFHFTKRTAYRYIKRYQNANRLPESIIKAALAKGVDITGDTETKPMGAYTAAVEKLPPPNNPSPEQAETWINQIEQVRKETRSVGPSLVMATPQDPDTLLKECYRFVNLRYRRLPNNSKIRANWVRNLTGMLLADLGVSGQQTIAPIAPPSDFKAVRGRPTIVATA